MLKNNRIYISDISKLRFTKVTPWKIYFKYEDDEYMIIDDGEPGEAHLSLYKRHKLDNGNHTVEYINGAITTLKPSSMIRDISKKKPAHLVYANIDRNWFVAKLLDLRFSLGYLDERQGRFVTKELEIDEEIRKLYTRISELRGQKAELNKDKYNIRKLGSKSARGNRIKKEMAERVHGKHDGDWCEEYQNFYGKPDPKYGGKLVDLYNLPVGTWFTVANGAWDGMITYDEHGDKCVESLGGVFKLTDNHHSIYIDRLDGKRI